jgi:hypothetical protein
MLHGLKANPNHIVLLAAYKSGIDFRLQSTSHNGPRPAVLMMMLVSTENQVMIISDRALRTDDVTRSRGVLEYVGREGSSIAKEACFLPWRDVIISLNDCVTSLLPFNYGPLAS